LKVVHPGGLTRALREAGPGDEITLCPGIHRGPFQLSSPVRLVAAPGSPTGSVVLRGNRRGPVVRVAVGTDEEVLLDGLRVLHGVAIEGGGVQILSGAATLVRCVIERNRAVHFGGGVFSAIGPLVVRDCLFRRNFALGGGALYGGPGARVEVTGGRFVRNRARCGGAVGLDGGLGELRGCLFADNLATLHGSAIAVRRGARLVLDRSVFAHNHFRPAVEVEDEASSATLGRLLRSGRDLRRTRGLLGRPVGAPAVVGEGTEAAELLGWSGLLPPAAT
jgi:hypothetical protein